MKSPLERLVVDQRQQVSVWSWAGRKIRDAWRFFLGAAFALIVGLGLASCGTGGPGNSSHQPNSCVGRPGGPCTPSEGNTGSSGNSGTVGGSGNSGNTSVTNNSGAIVR